MMKESIVVYYVRTLLLKKESATGSQGCSDGSILQSSHASFKLHNFQFDLNITLTWNDAKLNYTELR